jgi:pilus assembly protein CpaC
MDLKDGQSFAIAGLLDNRDTELLEKIPFIGDIPVLGKLFNSRSVTKSKDELLVIVTPRLVQGIQPGQPLPSLYYPKPFLTPTAPGAAQAPGQK